MSMLLHQYSNLCNFMYKFICSLGPFNQQKTTLKSKNMLVLIHQFFSNLFVLCVFDWILAEKAFAMDLFDSTAGPVIAGEGYVTVFARLGQPLLQGIR